MPRPITVAGFTGSNSAKQPMGLPETMGVRMENCMPGHGDMRPLNNHNTVATVPTSPQRLTIRRMGRSAVNDALYWLGWTTVVHATPMFGNDGDTERTAFTGSGTPKWTNNAFGLAGGPPYPQGTRELGVPAPTAAPQIALNVNGTGTDYTVYYVTTFVNDLGWESAPSPPSLGLVVKPGATLNIGNVTPLEAPPAGNYGITKRRIYRTQVGTSGAAEFFFLREITVGTTSTTDDAQALGELLPTTGFLMPPSDGFGLIALWDGMLGMLSGKELAISEPGVSYAWPIRYRKLLKDTPVATARWGAQNLLVLTTGTPVEFQGQDPLSIRDQPPRLSQPCASAQSVVSFLHGVIWASNEGLAYYGDTSQRLLTEDVITPQQWRSLNPASMVAGRWDRFYVCSYLDGSTRRAFMIDPLAPERGVVWLATGFDACDYDEVANALYILEGGAVRKFAAGGTLMNSSFTSKEFLQTHPVCYSLAKVIAETYPLNIEVWADGVLRTTRTVSSPRAFKMKDGFTAERWQIKLSGAVRIVAARLGHRPSDFKGI